MTLAFTNLTFVGWLLLLPNLNNVAFASNVSIIVAMTSAPPRFHSLHYTVESWLAQEQPIAKICIYIPSRYKRFRQRKRSGSLAESSNSHVEVLRQGLSTKSSVLAEAIINHKLVIVELTQDYGPVTRIVGMLSSIYNMSLGRYDGCLDVDQSSPDYWIVSDDDVGYDPKLTPRYLQALPHSSHTIQHEAVGLTQFAENYRLELPLTHDKTTLTLIPHVQGVDTYLVSNMYILKQQREETRGILLYPYFIKAVEFMHETCPESFYQDDYIVSVLFYMSGIRFQTIWDSHTKMVHHIEGVSKSHFQMHMSEDVFRKEAATKSCLVKYLVEIKKIVGYVSAALSTTRHEEL